MNSRLSPCLLLSAISHIALVRLPSASDVHVSATVSFGLFAELCDELFRFRRCPFHVRAPHTNVTPLRQYSSDSEDSLWPKRIAAWPYPGLTDKRPANPCCCRPVPCQQPEASIEKAVSFSTGKYEPPQRHRGGRIQRTATPVSRMMS